MSPRHKQVNNFLTVASLLVGVVGLVINYYSPGVYWPPVSVFLLGFVVRGIVEGLLS